jgi:hypothetical protein
MQIMLDGGAMAVPTLADGEGSIVERFRAFCGGADHALQNLQRIGLPGMKWTATREAGLSRRMAFVRRASATAVSSQ